MKIAFVGIEKNWENLRQRDYVLKFVRFHLELPYYYFFFGKNDVDIIADKDEKIYTSYTHTTKQYEYLNLVSKKIFSEKKYDIIIHWRKWFNEFYKEEAINIINCQDHSFSSSWKTNVIDAFNSKKLKTILCFPTWHERNLKTELQNDVHTTSGVTLGVDISVYRPSSKKLPYDLLWASDVGRGLNGAIELAIKLHHINNKYKLHVCWPDYDSGLNIIHPAIQLHKNLDNGPELWNLFNECGFLPYTSTFKEPSSRAHRQAMAAGCVVLYPSNMGTPSELIVSGVDGIVGGTLDEWVKLIIEYTENWDTKERKLLTDNARTLALNEDWSVQAKRFNKVFNDMLEEING